MSKENVIKKIVDSRTLKELAIQYMKDMGHVTNGSCTTPTFKGEKSSIELHFEFNDPRNPAKEKIRVKEAEAKKILAKKLGKSLDDVDIEIDRY